jgi:hypothetical protein
VAAKNEVKVPLKHPITVGDDTWNEVTLCFPIKGKHYREVFVEDPQNQKMAVLIDLLAAVSDMPRKVFLEIENDDLQAIFEHTAPFVQEAV